MGYFAEGFNGLAERCSACRSAGWVCEVVFFCLFVSLGAAQSPNAKPLNLGGTYRPARILIKPKRGIDSPALARMHSTNHAQVLSQFPGMGEVQVLSLPKEASVEALIARYQESGLVEFAEPDYLGHTAAAPNDPAYTNGTLWALNNYGQNGYTTNADIDAPEAWAVLNSASNIIVAVLDTGARYTH